MSIYHGDTQKGPAAVAAAVPLSTAKATEEIRALARSKRLTLSYKLHAKERLAERRLIVSDILYVLKHGFVHAAPEPATRPGFFRYKMQCRSPNSGDREVGVVVIPVKTGCLLKIVTVMWIDETSTIAGSIIGEEQ